MKILYHYPNVNTVSAGRTIANGYKNAFKDLGHKFRFLSVDDDQEELFSEYKPDIFFTSLSPFPLRYLDLALVKKAKKNGTRVFVNVPFWRSPLSKARINEAPSIIDNKEYVKLIQSSDYGDIYFNVCEQGDFRMEGFKKHTGQNCHTVLLAADKTLIYPEKADKYTADVSYIGTNLPGKRSFFINIIDPIRDQYDIKLYGQDWSTYDKYLGYLEKIGQYLNIPLIRNIRKPALNLEDERKIYSSSQISINIHEHYQKKYGDLNERTFKIPLARGFEIIDSVKNIEKYFKPGKEIIVAQNKQNWFDKIDYYLRNPDERLPIIEAGFTNVMKNHTYHNRVEQLISLFRKGG